MSIVLENVRKSFGRQTVVNDVSLDIRPGELFVLLGASGSGKSTLLRLIAGLTPVDSGQICLNGRDVTSLPPQQRGTGFVFQNYSLFRHMNTAQNIEFSLDIRGVPRQERQQRVTELLRLIGMDDLGGRMPSQLSGGQQQRVALARALAHPPEVLLLDEPFGALDVKIRGQLRQNLREIQQELGVTTILVTHDQEEAFALADRLGIIEKGRLLEVGTPIDLYRRPQHRFTATFLGSANLLRGQRNNTGVHVGNLIVSAPPNTEHLANQPVEIFCRPEQVDLALERDQLQGEPIGRGVVQQISFTGPLEKVVVHLSEPSLNGESLQALLHPNQANNLGITPGQQVWVGIKDFHLLPLDGELRR